MASMLPAAASRLPATISEAPQSFVSVPETSKQPVSGAGCFAGCKKEKGGGAYLLSSLSAHPTLRTAPPQVPRNALDSRFRAQRGFGGGDGGDYWKHLLSNPHVAHVFMENHDLNHEKVSTLPTGMVFFPPGEAHNNPDTRADFPARDTVLPLLQRRLSVLVADRTRTGTGQVLVLFAPLPFPSLSLFFGRTFCDYLHVDILSGSVADARRRGAHV